VGQIRDRIATGAVYQVCLCRVISHPIADDADLERNDLSAVCRPGTVSVDALCVPEEHPGLTHLVSMVSGQMRAGVGWTEVITAAFPPGSVSGAPKSSALRVIADLESVPRGPYCGAIGWVDADAGTA
jgi:para-aminobenzoate synthetase component 1